MFSDAGGTGRSFHADRTAENQERRRHYLVQAGWRADKAVQGFGRSHRTNQVSAPYYRLVTTDLNGQKRFLSSIARRLAQLGALTKGQRQTGNQGLFSEKDNLESQYARDGLRAFFYDVARNKVEGLSISTLEQEMGLTLVDPKTGGLRSKLPDVPRFLNRLLSMTIDTQNRVFDEFAERMEDRVELAIAEGSLDVGLETIKADKIVKEEERTVYTHPETGAETKYVRLRVGNKIHPRSFPM